MAVAQRPTTCISGCTELTENPSLQLIYQTGWKKYFLVIASTKTCSSKCLDFVIITSLSQGTTFSYKNGNNTVEVGINAEICFLMQNLFLLNIFPRWKKTKIKPEVWKKSFRAQVSSSNTRLLFSPLPTYPLFICHKSVTPDSLKKHWLFHNCIISQNRKTLLLAVMPWQIHSNQGVTLGRKVTRKHISSALEVHLFITNTDFIKKPHC